MWVLQLVRGRRLHACDGLIAVIRARPDPTRCERVVDAACTAAGGDSVAARRAGGRRSCARPAMPGAAPRDERGGPAGRSPGRPDVRSTPVLQRVDVGPETQVHGALRLQLEVVAPPAGDEDVDLLRA